MDIDLEKHLNLLSRAAKLCGIDYSLVNINNESVEYGACSVKLNNAIVIFRISKITPNKKGQFVTVWERNLQGKIEPYNNTDILEVLH